jgi:hypothetical protein
VLPHDDASAADGDAVAEHAPDDHAAGLADDVAAAVLARLCVEADAPVRRLLLTRGVALRPAGDGTWRLANVVPLERVQGRVPERDARRVPRGTRPADDGEAHGDADDAVDVAALLTRHGLRPFALVTTSAVAPPRERLVSAAGTLGWRPPLERLDGPALTDATTAQATLRLRFALDAIEHHAVRAAEGYAAAAQTARRLGSLFGARDLTTVAGQLAPLVELDGLLAAARSGYGAIASLLWATFDEPGRDRRALLRRLERPGGRATFDARVIACRGAPAELREALLSSWDAWGSTIGGYRGWLARLAAGDLAPVPLRVTQLDTPAAGHAAVWTVGVPLPDAPPARQARGRPRFKRNLDALEWGWELATEVARVASRATYAIAEG